jgi:hypothetical protein
MPNTWIPTEELADRLHLKPATLRSAVYTRGSYFGIIPRKLANGRLEWPPDSAERLRATPRQLDMFDGQDG